MAPTAALANTPQAPASVAKQRFAFVLEQTLGHVAHGRNLIRTVEGEPTIDGVILKVDFSEATGIHRLPGLRTWSWRASAAARDSLRAELRRGPLDAIFMHTQVLSLLSTDVMQSVPTVISLDATPKLFDREGEAYGHHRMPEPVEMIKKRFNTRAFSCAAQLVTWCRWAAYSLTSDYGVGADRIEVIPPGVNLELFRPSLLPRRPGPVRVLFVGGDFDRKGGPDLIEAARALADPVHLDIVTGTADVAIPPGISASIHRGLEPQSEKLVQLYRTADIFVLPSRGDCMPQAIAEALACGLPVVATAVGAIPEMVTDSINGYLVRPRSPRALAAAIASLMSSPRRRHTMGRWSHELALREHDATFNNARIVDLMKRVAARRLQAVS